MTLTEEELESCRAYDSTKRPGERHDYRKCKAVACRDHNIHSPNRTRCKAGYSNVCKICLPMYCPLEGGILNPSDIDDMYLRDETRKLLEEFIEEEEEMDTEYMQLSEIDDDFEMDEEWDDDIL